MRTRPRESESLLRRLDHGSDWLSACALVPGGDLLVSACTDRTLRVWDTATGRMARILGDMPAAPQACAATPDGGFVLATTGNPAGTLHVWEVRTGAQIAHVTAHQPSCTACAVLPDGSAVLTFGTDGRIRRWTLPDLRLVGDPDSAPEPLTCGVLSPDGTVLAYGGRQGVVYVRGLAAGSPVTNLLHGHGVPLTGCALGPGGRPLVTSGEDGRVVIWDLVTGHGTDISPSPAPVMHCALTDDGSLLATASDDGRVQLWELPALTSLGVLDAHTAMVVGCVLSRDGRTVASVSADGTVCLWDVAAVIGSTRGGHTGLVEHCTFTGGGTVLLTASTDGTVRGWETVTGEETGPVMEHPGETVRLLQHGDNLVLAAGEQGTVLMAENLLAQVPQPGRREWPQLPLTPVGIGEHGAQVWGLAPLPDGNVVTAGLDGVCRVWDLRLRTERLHYSGGSSSVRACATAADGSFVASAGAASQLHLWDPVSGDALVTVDAHTTGIRTVTVGSNGTVIIGGTDGTVTLTGPDTRWQPKVLGCHERSQVTSALWAATLGVVTGGVDGTLALWPASAAEGGWYRQAHRGSVLCLAASPSGTVLATGGADHMLLLWDSETGHPLACLPCAGRVHGVAFHPYEPVIACAGDGGLVCIAELIGLHVRW